MAEPQVRVERHLFNPFHSKSTGQFAPKQGGGGADTSGSGSGSGSANRGSWGKKENDAAITRMVPLRNKSTGETIQGKLLDRDKPEGEQRYREIETDAHPKSVMTGLIRSGFDGEIKAGTMRLRPGLTAAEPMPHINERLRV